MKYLHILIFLMTHDLTELKEFWRVEFMDTKKEFRWRRLFRALKRNMHKYIFWYRLAYFMQRNGNCKQKYYAERINNRLRIKYTVDISLDADIDIGLKIYHYNNVIITPYSKIGKNCVLHQNITLGQKKENMNVNDIYIQIGNNVYIGANSVILGGKIKIGNNVKIGAMSFVDKDLPDNCTALSEKKLIIN